MSRGVDLVRRSQALGQRLELIAAAGGQQQMAAFLGEGFGGRGADALRCAGDQDALAAQMKIHGICSLDGWTDEVSRGEFQLLGGVAETVNIAVQRCTVASFGPLQSDQIMAC